ncbi:D-alanyl-D-alanine carboxypeptidase [Candidatus Falkowbacteria bacterium]|nr:D-alanyl-D-alanine carboxypeptidase [Candidatus Falkowbacteria bacterium]
MSVQRLTIILLFNLTLWLGTGWWSAQQPVAPVAPQFVWQNRWPEIKVWPASSTIVWSVEQGKLISQNSQQLRPIASLSKMVTALVVLGEKPDWSALYTLKNEDQRYGNIVYIYPGETVTIKDLWQASLMASDNTATQALIRAIGLTDEQYQQKVVELAERLQISDLQIKEPTGLNPDNQASASAIARIANEALSQSEVQQSALLGNYTLITKSGRQQLITNTDGFVHGSATLPKGWQIDGGKTGYIDEAGYCFAALWQNKAGQQIVSVVLGAPTKEGRFSITKELLDYAQQKYY